MFTCGDSILIARKREHVFKTAETYPCFVRFFRYGKILYQDDELMRVKIGAKIFGVPTSWIGEGKKKKFETIIFTQTQGLFKGLIATWTFKEMKESTLISINVDFEFRVPLIGNFLENVLGKTVVAKTVRGILREMKREAETNSPVEVLEK